jgi:hypothetical protein
MTKDELLASIRGDRARLEALIAPLDEARLTEPALDAGWSVKDALAHISMWERICCEWLAAAARGETPARPEVQDVDGTNARNYQAAKGRPLPDVLGESRHSHQAMLDAASALSEAELADDKRFGWPTWQLVSANSDDHYREHIDQIARWLASSRA